MKDWDEEQNPLQNLTRKPPPPELKTNVLNAVRKKQEEAQAMTPFLRFILAASLGLAVTAVFIDGIFSRTSEKRLVAIGYFPSTAESSSVNSFEEIMKTLQNEYFSSQEKEWLRRRLKAAKRAEPQRRNSNQREIFEEITHEFSN